MVTTDLGACEWFVWDLRRSNLVDRGQLDQIIGEFLRKRPRAEPPELAEYLVSQGVLTAFQSERILQGKTQGLVLGPYTLMDAIGSGSMGTVYKAHSKTDNQWYAVKVLPRRSMWNVRLARRQVRAFEKVQHPCVVAFLDVGTAGGLHYLAWHLVEGETLESIVQREGKLKPDIAALYGLQVAQGLSVCHQNAVFHGLLKPSNLMIDADNRVRILDFGIGSLLAENEGESLVDTMSTANTMTSGLDCSSPECIMDPTNRTPAGDQYSLGCILYYCLTGSYPFPEGSAVEKMMAHQSKEPPPITDANPDVPPGLIAIILKLMAKTPEGRYGATEEVIEALQPFAATAPPPRSIVKTGGNGQAAAAGRGPAAGGAAAPPKPAPPPQMNIPTRKDLVGSKTSPAAASGTAGTQPAPVAPASETQPQAGGEAAQGLGPIGYVVLVVIALLVLGGIAAALHFTGIYKLG